MGPGQIVITGLADENHIDNYIYETGKEPEIVSVQKIGHDRSGTQEMPLPAIVSASVVRGDSPEGCCCTGDGFYQPDVGLYRRTGTSYQPGTGI